MIVCEQINVDSSLITYGGCLVWAKEQSGNFNVLAEHYLLPEEALELVKIGLSLNVHTGAYTPTSWHTNDLDYWALREARNTSTWPTTSEDLLSVLGKQNADCCKVMYRAPSDELDAVESKLKQFEESLFIHRSPKIIEVFPKYSVKMTGLKILAEHLNVRTQDIIAFGDSYSDVQMLEAVGTGVLMDNAPRDLQISNAVIRTLSNDEDGVAVMLRRYFPTDAPFRS